MRPILIFCFVFLVGMACRAEESALMPEIVLKRIDALGARKAVNEYIDTPAWATILRGIRSGEPTWLKVFSKLRAGSDAGASEDLALALFEAIPAKPFEVIPVISREYHETTNQVCTFTFEAEMPAGGINRYLSRIENALRQAATETERKIAAECLSGVKATREAFYDDTNY